MFNGYVHLIAACLSVRQTSRRKVAAVEPDGGPNGPLQQSTCVPSAQAPDHDWYQRPNGDASALPPRSHLVADSPVLALGGQWEFRSFASAESARRFCSWPDPLPPLGESITVPSHWVLDRLGDPQVHGKPWYTNVRYPFPVDPPKVPDRNPTAWYRRTFKLAELVGDGRPVPGLGDRLILRFEGVESAYRVWVNGQWVGQAMGSRLTHEFDVTDAVLAREEALGSCTGSADSAVANPTAVEHEISMLVHQFSAGSYLEDQDQWWLPGIFRGVSLLLHRPGDVWDVHVESDWEPATRAGRLRFCVEGDPSAFPVAAEIRRPDFPPVSVSIGGDQPVDVVLPDAHPWSPENPALIDVDLTTATGATVGLRAGVRRVGIDDDGVLRANGDALRFRGVNRHEWHPERGRAVTVEDTRRDFSTMVDHHVNAVRTSHYPPAAHALDLADEMGLWVVLEGDLETHGFVTGDWAGNPSNDPAWRTAILDRTARMWHRDKNHPSVAMLSIGNESGTGANLREAADWLRARSELPVHYEGDADAAYTDLHSRMYATPTEWAKLASGLPRPAWGPATAARVVKQPIVLCEYAHAMGNGPGGLSDYEQVFRAHPRACGGFVWEFKDHGLRVAAPSGGERVAYGGDFGELEHDGNFVLDGLCFSDGSPSPGMTEYAAVIDPLWIERDDSGVHIGNGYDHSRLEDVLVVVTRGQEPETSTFEYRRAQLVPGDRHLVVIAPARPGEQISVEVRADVVCGGKCASRTRREVWSGPLPGAAQVVGKLSVEQWPELVREARLSVWRAPTDNDAGGIEPARERFGDDPRVDWDAWAGTDPRDRIDGREPGAVVPLADRWKAAGQDRLMSRRNREDEEHSQHAVLQRTWRPVGAVSPRRTGHLRLACAEEADGSGLLEAVIDLDEGPRPGRIGVELNLSVDTSGTVEWTGGGPGEAAPDSARASQFGQWACAATDLTTVYPVPQSSGERKDLRHLRVPLSSGEVAEIQVLAVELDGRPAPEGLWWALSPWTDRQVARAMHADELPDPSTVASWTLHLDAAYGGLGSRSCGVGVAPAARIEARRARIVVRLNGWS
ncbi:beta-galactosidase [Kocuria soli]|uniref:beta-galactosidase n=1 Tax=Kocuria soli TaxID=2485125 RepID=A0A3N3ZQT1_9MICC|nr:beta-galactosidase [Kocuria soli]